MAAFLSKKQKAQMRERRRKKKLVDAENGTEEVETKDVPDDTEVPETLSKEAQTLSQPLPETEDTGANTLKRPREESSTDPSSTGDSSRKRRSLELETKVIEGKLHVVVPNKVPTKDTKKFRKEARRQLRMEEKDDSDLVFVDEDELPPSFRKTKKKKEFPSIKELLKQKEELKQAEKETEREKGKIHHIPDDIKSQYVALDCEMVGIGRDGKKSALARVSIVDWDLNVILDSFVKVPIRVTDFRTHVSGVEPKHIKDKDAMDVEDCRNKVAAILKDKILVGHALSNDFKALMLNHPKATIRDTAKYRPFQRYGNGKWRPRKLRDLVKENLKGKEGFQEGEHDSVMDASATMELFQAARTQWEKELANKK
jgi:RNA exonuclease 4